MIQTPTVSDLYTIFCRHPKICTDSRQVPSGAIFFALRGENFDGNRYACTALEAGASFAVMDNPEVAADLPEDIQDRVILVDHVMQALQALAAHHRKVLNIPMLAVTGSNGKTTTKELIARVLSRKYRVAATRGNLNNHIGVPLTLLAMDTTTSFGIVEMGANHRHEIEQLCRIARPDYGLITNIGRAHLEGFGGPEGIIKGKGELFDYLQHTGGTAFYLEDDPVLSKMVDERLIKATLRNEPGFTHAKSERFRTVPYSTSVFRTLPRADTLTVYWSGRPIVTGLVGIYNLNNLAAAIGVGIFFGIPSTEIAAAIESYQPDNNRSQRKSTDTNILILDAYNANPSSMAAALDHFFHTKPPGGYGKTVILGDMHELGSFARTEHRQILHLLEEHPGTEVFLVGRLFQAAASGTNFRTFETLDKLREQLSANPVRNRLILIKGSRGEQLEKIIDLL